MERHTSSNSSMGGASVAASTRRRQADFIKLATSGKYKVTASENVGDFYVLFEGPAETPYEGGFWNIHVVLTEQYPYKSPSIGFGNRIFHPNVEERSGAVCLDVINQTWTPMYDLVNVFDVFLPQLMRYPNSTDPMNPAAAQMQLQSMTSYTQFIQQHIGQHATKAKAVAVVAHLSAEGDDEDEEEDATPTQASLDVAPMQLVPPTAGATPCRDGSNPSVDVSPASMAPSSRGLTDSPPSDLSSSALGSHNSTPVPKAGVTMEDDDDDMPDDIDI